MSHPLQTLYDEHRSIAAVLHGMQYLVREHRDGGAHVDPKVFRAMLYYLDIFPEREHHPKEEKFLFARLRQRTHEADAVLDQLAEEHANGESDMRALEQQLVRYEAGGEAEFTPFGAAVDRYVDAYWAHMRKEEQEVMPLARAKLEPEDWRDIEAAFAQHRDPLQGAGEETDYGKLLTRIASLAPAPIGLGPPAK